MLKVQFQEDISSLDCSNQRIEALDTICRFTKDKYITHYAEYTDIVADHCQYRIYDSGLIIKINGGK